MANFYSCPYVCCVRVYKPTRFCNALDVPRMLQELHVILNASLCAGSIENVQFRVNTYVLQFYNYD